MTDKQDRCECSSDACTANFMHGRNVGGRCPSVATTVALHAEESDRRYRFCDACAEWHGKTIGAPPVVLWGTP
jgi:hypothetical protein